MRLVSVVRRWAGSSNDRAVSNAREATTTLSRLRVEREDVELYLARRYAVSPTTVVADARVAGEPR